MARTTRLAQVESAVRAGAAHKIVAVLRESLVEHYPVLDAEVFLVDYRLNVLEPVSALDEPGTPINGSLAGAAYRSQQPVWSERDGRPVGYLPLTVRSDRHGVLEVVVSGELTDELKSEFVAITWSLAHELALAEAATDLFRVARRPERLTLAAEIQWELLPGRAMECGEYSLAGQLEPAYTLRGDSFDWSADDDSVTVAVANGMGDSVDAALLTSLAINALRNARRAGVGLADQAALADQAIWAQHGGDRYVSTLLLRFDLATGVVSAVDAGSPVVWRLRGDEAEQIELASQGALGMFEETRYEVQQFQVQRGDRLMIISDGVFEARYEDTGYGTLALRRALDVSRSLPPIDAVATVMSDLRAFLHDDDLQDDAVVVCLDWRGR